MIRRVLIVLAPLLGVLIPTAIASGGPCVGQASCPPPTNGYFSTLGAGSWSSLPTGAQCAAAIGNRQSGWEIRPDNIKRNHVLVDPAAVHASFAARPHDGGYNAQWDAWLLPRVDGAYSGTTDEIFQWAACKWGIADNILRAQAVRESTWFQYDVFYQYAPRPNRCYEHWSCGDRFNPDNPPPYADRKTYCDGVAAFGWDYQLDGSPWGDGWCPRTFGILGVMSWQAPGWGQMQGNQNGTFPFNRNSTAFAADFEAANLRGCMEGWETWLPGNDIWGCVGSWFSGGWYDSGAVDYIDKVQTELNNHTWLSVDFALARPACDPTYGCAGPDTL